MIDPRKRGALDAYQDRCEGCAFASVGGSEHVMKAPDYIKQEDQVAYLEGYAGMVRKMYHSSDIEELLRARAQH